MGLDIAGVIIIVLFFYRGYTRGIILAVFSVLAILLGLLCALKLSQSFSTWLLEKGYVSSGWVQVVSYVILFVGVILVVRLIARLLQTAIEAVMLGLVNRLFGGLLYAVLGVIVWSSMLWIGARANMIPSETIATSKTYSWVSGIAPWFWFQAGKLIPFVQDTFKQLEHFFDAIKQKQS
jgi:membrane protein required for colicin V production